MLQNPEPSLWTPTGSTNKGQWGRAPGPEAHKLLEPLEGQRVKTQLSVPRHKLSNKGEDCMLLLEHPTPYVMSYSSCLQEHFSKQV